MVANSDKPLNPKDHVEELVAHQHDLSTLSRDIHHAPFKDQHEVQKAALKANGDKPKGVSLDEAQKDETGHIISGKIKLPGGDSYERTTDGNWVWHTVKDGQPRDFKITGLKELPHIDADGKFTMRFADGRKHTVDKNNNFIAVNDTVKVTFKDGRRPEFLPADEATIYTAPNANLAEVASVEKIKRDHWGTIEEVTTAEGTAKCQYEYDENGQPHLMTISYPDSSKMLKKDGHWERVKADGTSEPYDGDVIVDQDQATFEFRKRPQFSNPELSDALPPGFVMPAGYDALYGEARKKGRSENFWQNASIIAETAKNKGNVPADYALATSLVETGGTLRKTIRGDGGASYGLFQLYTKGGQGNELLNEHGGNKSVLENPELNSEMAIRHMSKTIAKYGNSGRSYAQLMALSQRPADPAGYARAVESRLKEARSILQTVDRIAAENKAKDTLPT